MITKIKKEYKCPECSGIMKSIAGDDVFQSFQCEICKAYFRVNVKEKLNIILINGQEVIMDNPKAYSVLKIIKN